MTKRITISLTDKAHEMLEAYANKAGMKISTVIERLIAAAEWAKGKRGNYHFKKTSNCCL